MRLIDAKEGTRLEWRDPVNGRLVEVNVLSVGKRDDRRFARVQRSDGPLYRIEEGDRIPWADDRWEPLGGDQDASGVITFEE